MFLIVKNKNFKFSVKMIVSLTQLIGHLMENQNFSYEMLLDTNIYWFE